MKNLLREIDRLKKTEVKQLVDQRISEFKKNKNHFNELCFCLLTANTSAELGIKCQNAIGDGFKTLTQKQLAKKLKSLGGRFYNRRSEYIVEARNHKLVLERDWLVDNIKGIGMKEASHFLRNIGYDDYAILDFHVVDILVENGLVERPKTMTKKKYLEIEEVVKRLAKKSNLTLAELDLYLWYLETGKVLK